MGRNEPVSGPSRRKKYFYTLLWSWDARNGGVVTLSNPNGNYVLVHVVLPYFVKPANFLGTYLIRIGTNKFRKIVKYSSTINTEKTVARSFMGFPYMGNYPLTNVTQM